MKKCFIVLLIALCVLGIVACKHEPAAHEHTWNDGEITTPATCTDNGVKTYKCTGCGETKTEVIAATGHTFSDEWSWDVNEGTHYHAATCGHTDVRGDEASHTYNQVPTTPATCTENGLMTWTCSVCGIHYQTQIDRLGHDLSEEYAEVPATCTTDGTKAHRHCSRCDKDFDTDGNLIADVVIPAAHTWDEGTPDGGFIVFECQVCHETMKKQKGVYDIGDTGPGGGIVFYNCDADNTEEDPDGADNLKSSECGWKYLEAAPRDLKVVDGVPSVDSELEGYHDADSLFIWAFYRESSGSYNLLVNGKKTHDETCTGSAIGTGESNTDRLVAAMGNSPFAGATGDTTTTLYAAKLCSDLEYNDLDDWFLPSLDELNLMYELKDTIGGFIADRFWSSTESDGPIYSMVLNFADGGSTWLGRNLGYHIRPIRSFI